jgi:hypothetical protein
MTGDADWRVGVKRKWEGQERRVGYPQREYLTHADGKKEVEGELHWS